MIKSIEQAKEVQIRRVAAKKRGYSKAVRTFLLNHAKAENLEYLELRNELPVTWVKPKAK